MKTGRNIFRNLLPCLFAVTAFTPAVNAQEDPSKVKAPLKIKTVQLAVPATEISSIGGFAGGRIDKNKANFLETFPIDHYIGLVEEHSFTAWDWRQGEQPGKWLESAILTAARTHDAALEKEARSMYERVLRSQGADGYVGITSASIRTPEKPLRGMDAYELYFLQHAFLTAYEVWKDPKGLAAAKKLGDYFLRTIGPGKAEFWPSSVHAPDNKEKVLKGSQHSDLAGHSIHYSLEGTLLIDPMMRLYELTGDPRYESWCKWVVNSIDKWSGWDTYSNLDKVAAGEMPINKVQPYVHAHTFQMNFLGLLRLYQMTGDSNYLRKVAAAWNDVATRQRYITGGVSVGEHYERDFIKPLTGEMMETCATMSWMQLSEYLLDLTGDTKYADAIETILWNQVFAEQTIDGDANRYFTPPNGYVPRGYFREPDCCMSSGNRLQSMLPGFIYATGPAGGIYINQFIPSSVSLDKVKISQETEYPSDGKVTIHIDPATTKTFAVYVRIPGWCKNPTLSVNGKTLTTTPGAYVKIARAWKKGDLIVLDLPMELEWVRHEHYMKTSDRKPYKAEPDADAPYALLRGPLVYAVDDIWYKGDTTDFRKGWMDTVKYILEKPSKLKTLTPPEKDLLGPGYEISLLLSDGKKISLPVYPFVNIGKWYKDPAHKPDSNAAAWTYAIWLKGVDTKFSRLSLPKIFGNNMVLQRNQPVPVWGQASSGAKITVSFGTQQKETTTDAQGAWKLMLDPLTASDKPAEMLIRSGAETVRYENILVGEVWLCSGQSNMEYSMRKNSKFEKAAHGAGPEDELNKAKDPAIRIFLVRNNYSKPDDVHIRRAWDTAAGGPLKDFSAAGYFFAKELHRKLGVPIGIIGASVSGSAIEPFLPGSGSLNAADETETSNNDGVLAANDKGFTGGNGTGGRGKFFTSMIKPLAPFALKGFLWYQGETNCFLNDTIRYTDKMKTLIDSWRNLWSGPDLSFYFVQITPFYYSHSNGGDQPHSPQSEPAFWEAQARTLAIPHTGMVITTDLVDSPQDLHPAYKWEVGRRLALWALANDYGMKDLVYSGPVYKSVEIKGKKMILNFDDAGGGLMSKDGKPLDWFELAGPDGKFISAQAMIKGDQVIVTAAGIAEPTALRFGWNEAAQPNLHNKEGLPAMPFRIKQ